MVAGGRDRCYGNFGEASEAGVFEAVGLEGWLREGDGREWTWCVMKK